MACIKFMATQNQIKSSSSVELISLENTLHTQNQILFLHYLHAGRLIWRLISKLRYRSRAEYSEKPNMRNILLLIASACFLADIEVSYAKSTCDPTETDITCSACQNGAGINVGGCGRPTQLLTIST